ncbi:MAG: hypothetical protein NZM18_07570 [Thermoflexales bacterium]|nr:hypothetical protein [Thermoflexales bacterium]MDW8350761.1 hypothetical protein [Anaerolineae bacterium]
MKDVWMLSGWNRRAIRVLLRRSLRVALAAGLLLTSLRFDVPPYGDREAHLDRLLAGRQFDLFGWWVGAMAAKLGYELILPHESMSDADQVAFVQDYMRDLSEFKRLVGRIEAIYSDPDVGDAATASAALRARRDALRASLDARQDIVEAILQDQVQSVLREEGFAIGGQVMPPLRFRFTALPDLLVVSRRDKIERIASRELTTGLTLEEKARIEEAVDRRFDVSSLVTPIGGLGAYPTMLPETPALEWVLGVIAHEWVHNYFIFTLSPVGLNFLSSSEARTINETAAVIVEREVRERVAQRYYPERHAALVSDAQAGPRPSNPQAFDFRAEMRKTRERVDELLAQGKIEEAEAYMEQRRVLFVRNGYMIRKLNQAYFAFHGAYNADPGGSPAAGRDPVGPAVQELRRRSPSLGAFLREIATVRDFADLQRRLRKP